MRKVKDPRVKAINVTISMPVSLKEYSQDNIDISEFVQQKIAQDVLSVSYTEHFSVYSHPGKSREFKPESPKKSFIRCARWVLESEIRGIWINKSHCLVLGVYWKLTGATTLCFIDLDLLPGFKHICYDDSLSARPTGYKEITKDKALRYLCTIPGYKSSIAHTWIWRSAI